MDDHDLKLADLDLTERQAQVAKLHWQDKMGYKRIGLVLSLSPSTVRSHLDAIAVKLEARADGKVRPTGSLANRVARLERIIHDLKVGEERGPGEGAPCTCTCQTDVRYGIGGTDD